MDRNDIETKFIRGEIERCEDIEQLKSEIFPMIRSQQEQWAIKVNSIIKENGFTKSRFAELCQVSRVSVDKWCKGAIPKNRETFLRIGLAAGYDLEHMNLLLQRYGQYPGLYSKSLEDCVCIFVINNHFGEEAIGKYYYILDRIKENITQDDTRVLSNIRTEEFDVQLAEVQDEDMLEQFINENGAAFLSIYQKFYAYVKMYITINYQRFSTSVFNMAEGQGWSSSLRQCVSAIRQNKWYPTRNKIISLGLHLSMDHEQIDEMLQLAHMEPLCAKNIFESVMMFILDDASLNNMLDTDSEEFDPDELCRYARSVLCEMNLPEMDAFIAELPEMDNDAW